MSSHHSQRFYDLHHAQVAAARERRYQRNLQRFFNWQIKRTEARDTYCYAAGLSFICFTYSMFMPAVYLAYYF